MHTKYTTIINKLNKIPWRVSMMYLINEKILKLIEKDLAKPLSRYDSELDYLPTQYISDFAKFLGYDGVKYYSTFDKDSYNLALFNSDVCKCVYRKKLSHRSS